ncbi:MAG: hypothetical protein NTY02_11930 [Acidobacteria bacterium]|nr:hypothetical protein [Acidobacteriota bacterium]
MQARWLTHADRRQWMVAVLALALALAGAVSCGRANTTGRSPSYLVIDSLLASSGATPDTFGNALESDVITNVKVQISGAETYVPTIFEDRGRVSLKIALKDTGTTTAPTTPTSTNSITVTRYHVDFKRTDGRNTQGVDVPYGFDGGATGTFDANGGLLDFVLVRAQAKLEAPLRALRGAGGAVVISTLAEITFYGTDQNGNTVSVSGTISVNFADWGDPI